MVVGCMFLVVLAHQVHADTVAEAIFHLQQRQPVLVTLESTQGTLQSRQAYWLSYDASVTPAAFNRQGFSTSWATSHMARHTNALLNAGQVNCWGMQATIAETGGTLYSSVGGARVARIAP